MQVHRTPLFNHAIAAVECITIQVDHFRGIFQAGDFLFGQHVSIKLARRWVFFDLLVHHRLGCTWLIGLVMPMATVADQIDHHVTFEGVTEIQRQAGHKGHRFRIVSIYVEDRRLHHLGDVSTIFGRTRIQRVGGSETNLVVDHDTHRAAHFVAASLRHVQGFLNHALAGNGGITVDGDWQYHIAARFVQTVTTSTN
ncbi:hypothetical protein D3C72_1387970 [compost metagenome]